MANTIRRCFNESTTALDRVPVENSRQTCKSGLLRLLVRRKVMEERRFLNRDKLLSFILMKVISLSCLLVCLPEICLAR